ncbi:MAG: M24 family metallopeptidase, partial [Pseudolysinimonas sp.]
KTSVNVGLAHLRTNNYVLDVRTEPSSNRLSELQLGLNHGRRIGNAFVNIDLGMQSGIGLLDAQSEEERDEFGNRQANSRYRKYTGTFSAVQRRVYEAVREAADAAFAIVRPGIRFREIHAEAMRVIAEKTAEWGFLPVSAAESLDPDAQYHRRYMVHGTSHHLGIDVHDCAQARRELYLEGVLEPGMVFTIEPGLYFQPDDLTVPEEYRGIGVRIEDNILVTEGGAENLSVGIPRTADDVEAWLAGTGA